MDELIYKFLQSMQTDIFRDLREYLIATTSIVALIFLFRSWANDRRIQKRRATKQDIIREFLSSNRSILIYSLVGTSIVTMQHAGLVVGFTSGPISWSWFAFQAVTLIVLHDAYFYWMHRWLHSKRMFKIAHLHHHKSRTPTPWAAYSFATIEAVFEGMFLPVALAIMGSIDENVALLFGLHMIIRNVIGHSGIEVFPAGWVHKPWLDWITTTTHHDLHHSEGRYNFGLYFTWWDRWMGTEHPQYKQRFDAVALPWWSRKTDTATLEPNNATIAQSSQVHD